MAGDTSFLAEWLKWLEKLPKPLRGPVQDEIHALRETVLQARAPRLLVIGRRGSGKSMLINAILGREAAPRGSVRSTTAQGHWYEAGALRVLDTRGVGDRTRPQSAAKATALEEIRAALEESCPDAVLFLVKAKEVDARIEEDLRDLAEILSFIRTRHRYEAPLIALATQIDELDPASVVAPPFIDDRKQSNIAEAGSLLEQALEARALKALITLPVCAYFETSESGALTPIVHDRRWNIDRLVSFLTETLPRDARLGMARAGRFRAAQRDLAHAIVKSAATIAAGIGATPIPIADMPVITGLQLVVVNAIASLGGREISKDTAREFLAALGLNLGAGFAFREAARALVKFVFPGGGLAISGAVAFGGTWAVGEAAIVYFLDDTSIDEARRRFAARRRA